MRDFTILFSVIRKSAMLLMLSGFFFLGNQVFSQSEDNPNLDQVPRHLRESPPPQQDAPLSSVITINNWDNFNLGTDFAETNAATNPAVPSWFYTAYNTNSGHHTEDGYTWANTTPSFGVGLAGDPVSCYDSLGNLFYINLYPASTIAGTKCIKSSNNGQTWGTAVTACAGNDKCWIACDQTAGPNANNVYVCMTNNGVGSFAVSTDHGATFNTTFTPNTQSLPGMMVCVGPGPTGTQGGSVYVVTNSGGTFASTYTFYSSNDGGQNFNLMSSQHFSGYVGTASNSRHSVEGMRTRPYPFIAADNSYGPNRGRLYNIYASNDPPGDGNKPAIWVRYSTDQGVTWSSAIKVNDDPSSTNNHHFMPAPWCDKATGRLYIQWMDSRDCPTHDSCLIYASYSDNGGVTWVANQPISNKKMKIYCGTCGGGGTPTYQGDYNGIVSNKKVSMAAWTDFRNGTFMSATGYFPDFAMALSKSSDTLNAPSDSSDISVLIPGVKLYADTVLLSAVLNPTPTAGTITITFPQGNILTSYPGSKAAHIKLTGSVPVGNYQATFIAQGPNGTPVHKRILTVKVTNQAVPVVVISATPDSICQGATVQLNAAASGGTPPYTYAWTSNPAGFTSTLPNPTVTPNITTRYKVTVNDNGGQSVKDSVLVTVLTVPPSPLAIFGLTSVCKHTSSTYNIAEVTGATSYSWTVPSDATIQSGQNTIQVDVLWGEISGNISVIAGNACGNSNPTVLGVALSDPPPTPGTITGPDSLCANTPGDYSIVEIPTALTYFWTVPEGASILTGQNTPAIHVSWGAISGDITVLTTNDCGASSPASKGVIAKLLPGAASSPVGNDTVCKGLGGYAYSVSPIAAARHYVWSLPEGASIAGIQDTNAITVDFGQTAIGGDITVFGRNECGDGTTGSKTIAVKTCAGIHENMLNAIITIYPNPASGVLNLSVKGKEKQMDLLITDVNGRAMYREQLLNIPAELLKKLDVSTLARGVYFIKLTSNDRLYIEKFVVE
jgi:hypothetical protein